MGGSISAREPVATLRTLQLILWYSVGSSMFSWRTVRLFNHLDIYPETCLIQDGSSLSLFRNQEIYILSILCCPCKAVLNFSCLRNLIPWNSLGVLLEWHSFVFLNSIWDPLVAHRWLSIFFNFLPWLDSWQWNQESCPGHFDFSW